jgi:CHAT domain-containing protein
LADNGDWRGAFIAAERAKARSLVDLLAERRDIAAPATNDASVRQWLAQATVENTGIPSTDDAVRSIKLVADARSALSSAAPEAASLVSVQAIDVEQISSKLAGNESLLDYFRAGDDLYALVLNGSNVSGFKLSATGLDDDVRAFRTAIENRSSDVDARSRALYDRLVRPLAPALTGERLTISPHGALHYLPFDALSDGDRYLLDRYALRFIPSAGALVYLKSDRPTKAGTLLAFGNPDLGDPRYDLPNAQVEAQKVAALFPSSRALVRGEASKSAVESLGASFSMLHFATHGKFNAETPLASGLYLAAATPADGVLTVGDLYTLRFDADLVTLSACETGLGKIANGDDVIGLTRGFLYAGARTIVASLWEVDDAATAELMVDFYRDLKTTDKRDALREAQIETRAKYPQPMYWAAFQAIGDAD